MPLYGVLRGFLDRREYLTYIMPVSLPKLWAPSGVPVLVSQAHSSYLSVPDSCSSVISYIYLISDDAAAIGMDWSRKHGSS